MQAARPSKQILIIEDDAAIRDALQELLNDEGYHVRLAENGQIGLQSLQAQTADLVLLDLMMPVMDGYAFMEALRRLAPSLYETVPVLLITAAGESAAKLDGVQETIRKPIDVNQLLSAIARYC